MSASTKLSNAVKALCYLAREFPLPKTSIQISEEIGVNASKLRKLLSLLSKEGIVSSGKGAHGGFVLKKNPDNINLQEIYCGVEDRKIFHLDVNKSKGKSLKNGEIANIYFLDLFMDVQKDIEEKMKKIKLADIVHYIKNYKNLG